MIGALMILNARGNVVLSRTFRDGCNVRGLAESFRNELISTDMVNRGPISIIGGFCCVHMRFGELYLVLLSDENVNCFLCLQYAVQLLDICQAYFEGAGEDALKDNFLTMHQLIDETMDFGYPQITDVELLRSFISSKGIDVLTMKKPQESAEVTARIMRNTPFRPKNLWYRSNDLFVDVVEEMYLLVSQAGQVLENNVMGRVLVKSFLSGFPECQLVPNDDFNTNDAFFHPCVRVGAEREVTFVPLDGVFPLMRYRVSLESPPPLKVVHAYVKDVSKTRIEVGFGLVYEMLGNVCCKDVEVRLPCPVNTADVRVNVGKGSAKFEGVSQAIIWKLPSVSSKDRELLLTAEFALLAPTLSTSERVWSRPPIKIGFTIPSHTLSGFSVKELRVKESLLCYTPTKWIRYTTKAGQYEWRI